LAYRLYCIALAIRRHRLRRIVPGIPVARKRVARAEPGRLRLAVHVQGWCDVDLTVDIGANDMDFPRPALRPEEKGGAAVGAKPAFGIRGRVIPAQGGI